MQQKEQQLIIESLLFSTADPLTQKQLKFVFNSDPPDIQNIITELNNKYVKGGHSFYIRKIAGGYQITTKAEYEIWIHRLFKKNGQVMLSRASLETMAIVAYRQPISRYETESIRGVDCTGVLKTLLTYKLIRIQGRDSGPGRPLLYGTTKKFLENFGLNSISEIPKLKEISELSNSSN